MEVLIAFITFFAMMFGIFYMYFNTRNRERLALIEKGADASLFHTPRTRTEGTSFGKIFNVLKVGLFLIGIGVGVAIGFFLGQAGMHEGASYPSMIFLFGGLGLVVYYLISRDK
jgi:hypothetical protein